jgi:hypothetical protein
MSGGDGGSSGAGDRSAGSDEERTAFRWAVRVMQVGLAAVTLFGLVTFRWGLVINAGVSLGVTFLPGLLERDLSLPMNPALVAWITFAVFLHAVGALGPYKWFGWYDSVTHTLSATIVAGAGYATARALDEHYDRLEVPPAFMFGFIVVFVLAFGVLWEIMEFASGGLASIVGGQAVLAQYGASDIVYDLTFNAVGGVLVALFGTSRLRDIARSLSNSLGS